MNNQKGFSLIEMMVTIAIIAVLSGIAIPNAISWRSNAQLNSAAREVLADFQRAKSEAIKRNRDVEISFTTGKGAISEIAFAGTSPKEIIKTGSPYLGNIEITTADGARFNSRGLPVVEVSGVFTAINNNLEVKLTNGKRTTTVEVTIGGNIRIES